MRVIISAAGTGGHIYPALSIIDKIKEKEPDSKFLYIGTTNRMEKDLIPSMGIDYVGLKITGFKRKLTLENFKTINYFFKAIKEAKKIIKEFKPDIVIGAGGYVTGPVIYAAHKLKIKTFIHEQNSIPGLANKFLSRYADKIGISIKDSQSFFPKNKVVYTGNPRGEAATKALKVDKKQLGVNPNKDIVLIVMGSLGANRVNNFMLEALEGFKDKDYNVIYVTGNKYYEEAKNKKMPSNVYLKPYIENLIGVLKSTSLIVTRAGATTISEITTIGVPTIFIPSPFVPDDHQTKNALSLVKENAALMIAEKDLDKQKFISTVDELMKNKIKRDSLTKQVLNFGVKDSAERIYKVIKDLTK